MTNLLETFEKEKIEILTSKKRIPAFRPGDSMKISVKIFEGERSRLQAFEGICIGRKNNGLNSSFTIRKISHGEGVEKVFPLFSPIIDKIEVIRKGDVNRAKLYYLRKRTGKRARISDRDRGEEADQYELVETSDTNNKTADSEKPEKIEKNETKEINEKNQNTSLESNKPVEEKSESLASEADKTKDESKV